MTSKSVGNSVWPAPYFFSIATDFPHKNLPNLLDAYALLAQPMAGGRRPRAWFLPGTPRVPEQTSITQLESRTPPEGVTFLGTVTRDAITSALSASHGPGVSVAL